MNGSACGEAPKGGRSGSCARPWVMVVPRSAPRLQAKKEDKLEDLSEQEQERLLSLENELLGLDKYMGGDSEYLTVVTYSDDYVGAIALFQAKLSPDHRVTTLDRIAMISDVPRKICDILQDEIKPNRYVVTNQAQGQVF